jgi:DNA ligase-1
MTANFKPLLACEADLEQLKFPLLVSPKLDGIRCVIHPELGPVTRNLKPIQNGGLRQRLSELPPYLDGELIAGSPSAGDAMQRTTSAVMGRNAAWDHVRYYVFDHFETPGDFFSKRHELAAGLAAVSHFGGAGQELTHYEVHSLEELMALEEDYVSQGYEGIMLRDPDGRYKFGRSTVNEGILLKLKRFEDAEGVVVGCVEKMHNENAATKDALGRTKRSSSKKNKVPTGTLGALVLRIEGWPSETVEVGSGFTEEQRSEIWANREALLGHEATFKFQRSGAKDAPRFPVFKGFREDV